jgi:hypothetical protein
MSAADARALRGCVGTGAERGWLKMLNPECF